MGHNQPAAEAFITIKNKPVLLRVVNGFFGIAFGSAETAAVISVELTDISLTRCNNESYLNAGLMLFGPLDDDSARTIAGLIQPTLH
ncbi:MAG: hypothetical protein LRY66_05910 [Saccharospirillaceae bacterium]|nr:hypothetical protein [Saccharospirillaceae bacterium]MCD8530890.1 hypothetical protein [Saccharospirillaceae bacterium]